MGVFKAIGNGIGTTFPETAADRHPLGRQHRLRRGRRFSSLQPGPDGARPFLPGFERPAGRPHVAGRGRPQVPGRDAGHRRRPRRFCPSLPRSLRLPQRRHRRPPPRQGRPADRAGVLRRLRPLFRKVRPAVPRLARLPRPDLRRRPPPALGPDEPLDRERLDGVAVGHPVEPPFPGRPSPSLRRPHGLRLRPHRRRRRRRDQGPEGPPPRPQLPQEALFPVLGPLPADRRRVRRRDGRFLRRLRAPLRADGPLRPSGFVWMQLYVFFRIWVGTLFVAAQAEFYRSHPY